MCGKRLGWLACAVFLDLDGVDPTAATDDDIVDLVAGLAATQVEVEEPAAGLRSIIVAADDTEG